MVQWIGCAPYDSKSLHLKVLRRASRDHRRGFVRVLSTRKCDFERLVHDGLVGGGGDGQRDRSGRPEADEVGGLPVWSNRAGAPNSPI
jgi:hypothetical protein